MTNAAKDDAPGRIWAFEYSYGVAPRSGDWIDEQSECPEGSPSYILETPEALAASPVVQAMLREARAEGMEWAAGIAAETAADAKKEPGAGWASHSWLMAVCRTLEAEAAAVRKGETK